MNLMCCVKNPLFLGCFASCGSIVETGQTASSAGAYNFLLSANGFTITVVKQLETGDNITISTDGLNENTVYVMSVTDPANNAVLPSEEDTDGFSFKTVLTANI